MKNRGPQSAEEQGHKPTAHSSRGLCSTSLFVSNSAFHSTSTDFQETREKKCSVKFKGIHYGNCRLLADMLYFNNNVSLGFEGLRYAVSCTHGYRFFYFFIRANVINDVKTRTFQRRKKRIMVYDEDYDFVTGNALQQYYILH